MMSQGDQCSDKKRSISSRMLPTCSIFRTSNIFCVNSRGKLCTLEASNHSAIPIVGNRVMRPLRCPSGDNEQ